MTAMLTPSHRHHPDALEARAADAVDIMCEECRHSRARRNPSTLGTIFRWNASCEPPLLTRTGEILHTAAANGGMRAVHADIRAIVPAALALRMTARAHANMQCVGRRDLRGGRDQHEAQVVI